MNDLATRTPARLGGHPGELVHEGDRTLVWQGEITPTLLTDLMRVGSRGPVQVQRGQGPDEEAWIERLWFDVERGRMTVHLLDRRLVA